MKAWPQPLRSSAAMADDETDLDVPAGPTGDGAVERAAESGPESGSSRSDAEGPASLWQRARAVWANPAYRFVLLFLPYLGVVSIGYPAVVRNYSPIIQWFIRATAAIEYWIFVPFTSDITLDKKLVMFGGFAVKIIDECTGIYEMLIFSAAVLAFPTSWGKKLVGILLGNPLIYLFNVARIAALIVVGRYQPGAFEFMHLYFWQATMIVMITSVWLLWIIKVVQREENPPAAAA